MWVRTLQIKHISAFKSFQMQTIAENGDPPSEKQNEEKTYKKVCKVSYPFWMIQNNFTFLTAYIES